MRMKEVSEQFAQARRQAAAIERCGYLIRQAIVYDLWRRLRREATDLIRFDDIVRHIHGYQKISRGIRSVPLQQIVGSVGRSRDFTRDFLPRRGVNQERWARIDRAFATREVLPAVELYQVGKVYFVTDGHHRISVACARGFLEIEANVTEVETSLPLTLENVWN